MVTGWDRLNPVLVREYQQVVRSRVFVGVCATWLAAQLVAGLIFLNMQESGDADVILTGPGPLYFGWIMAGLSGMFGLILPAGWFARMMEEKRGGMFDVVLITRLTAQRVVLGFYWTMGAQLLVLEFMALPFLVFAYLYRGLGLGAVAAGLYGLLLGGSCAGALGLLLGSFAGQRGAVLKAILSLLMLGYVSVFIGFLGAGVSAMLYKFNGWVLGAGAFAALFSVSCFALTLMNITRPVPVPSWSATPPVLAKGAA